MATTPLEDIQAALEGVVSDTSPVAVAVIGVALGLGAAVFVARRGFSWIRSFVK